MKLNEVQGKEEFLTETKTIKELLAKLDDMSDFRDKQNYPKLMKQVFEWVKTGAVDVRGFTELIDNIEEKHPMDQATGKR